MQIAHAFSFLALAATPGFAQVPDGGTAPTDLAAARRALVGLEQLDLDSFVGAGADYKVHFEPGAVAVTPYLGSAAPHDLPLEFTLESIEHGGEPLVLVDAPVAPALEGEDIVYAHAAGVVERYELRPEGVYQSFLFPEPPAGVGDLVVRGRLATELEARREGDGVRFALPGIGGLSYGAVVGIDAEGSRFPGELHVDGDTIELRLAAGDVARATYPLLLDPLIGAAFSLQSGVEDDGDVDVAYSLHLNRWLVVFSRRASATDSDILGYQVQNGAPIGSLRLIETGPGIALSPSVAFVPVTGRYLVAWQDQPSIFDDLDIRGRAVLSSGTLGPQIAIATTSANERDPDVGGERSNVDDEALVVWEEDGAGIRMTQVRLTEGAEGAIGQVPLLSTSPDVRAPAISKTPDDAGICLVVWEEDIGNLTKIRGRAVTRNALTVTGVTAISDPLGLDFLSDSNPDVDTTGDGFVVAYEENETLAGTAHDIEAVRYQYAGGALTVDSQTVEIENDVDDDELRPTVAFLGESLVIGYHDDAAGGYDAFLKAVDQYTVSAVKEALIDSAATDSGSFRIAARWSAGATFSGEILGAWDSQGALTNGDIYARGHISPYNSNSLGGGCGAVGFLAAPAPYEGNAAFRVHLRDSVPGAIAALAVSPTTTNSACGPCILRPNLNSAQIFVAVVPPDGALSQPFPVPPGFGPAGFTAQWGVFNGGGCGFFGGFDLTDARRINITDF
ncbi:MAG: hypothetical protein WD226_05970 [Planctomycetota bacterium]